MSEGETAGGILVALDLSPESLAAAELAVELAAASGARIEGLFVEERELLDLAGHPLAREVDVFGTEGRPLERERLEWRLRAQASRARTLLAKVAGRRGIAWSFRVVRGTALEEIRIAARAADVVTLGRIGWSPRPGLGGTTQRLLAEASRVLVPGRRAGVRGPVVACYDGSPAGERVLDVAARLASAAGSGLRVEVVAAREDDLGPLRERARAALSSARIAPVFHALALEQPAELAARLRATACGFLVVPARVLGDGADLLELVADLDCPILLVR